MFVCSKISLAVTCTCTTAFPVWCSSLMWDITHRYDVYLPDI